MRRKQIFLIEPPADMSTLPKPPVPHDLDLRHFDCMHLDVKKFLESDLLDEGTGDEITAAVQLWCRSWWQVPCSSLPNDLAKVRKIAGLEGNPKRWKVVQIGCLRGFRLCQDGRLYHLVIAEKAQQAWRKSRAGKRGAIARWSDDKPLEDNKTGDAIASSTTDSKGDSRTHGRTDSRADGKPDGKTMQGREGKPSPYSPPSVNTAGSVGCADAPPSRPSTKMLGKDQHGYTDEHNRVCVHLDDGPVLKINPRGGVDVSYEPRDYEKVLSFTREQALELRHSALESIAERRLTPQKTGNGADHSAPTLPHETLHAMAITWFATGTTQVGGGTGPPWRLKVPERRTWPFAGPKPFEHGFPDDIAEQVCREVGADVEVERERMRGE